MFRALCAYHHEVKFVLYSIWYHHDDTRCCIIYTLRAGSVPSWSCSQAVSKSVWHITLLCVQWKTPDDGQRNCPKHVEIYSKNKFEKLVHLVCFIVRIYHDARSPERQNSIPPVTSLHEFSPCKLSVLIILRITMLRFRDRVSARKKKNRHW